MILRLPKRTKSGFRSTVRERAARERASGPPRGARARLIVSIVVLLGILPALAIGLSSIRPASPPPIDPSTLIAAARTAVSPTPTPRTTPRATPTPWPLDLWTRSVAVSPPEGGWTEVDVEIPIPDSAVTPVSVGPTGGTPASTQGTSGTATPEPEIVSAEEIARIQAAAQAAVAAEAARAPATPIPKASGGLGATVPQSIRRWEGLIVLAADRYKGDPNLIAALMMTESEGNPNALSSADAVGLMQIIGGPWDPAENIRLGTAILADNLRRYDGRVDLALAGYNAGNGAVAKYGGIPPYRETRDHVFRVLLRYELYRTG